MVASGWYLTKEAQEGDNPGGVSGAPLGCDSAILCLVQLGMEVTDPWLGNSVGPSLGRLAWLCVSPGFPCPSAALCGG